MRSRLVLLGTFALVHEGHPVTIPTTAQRLLAFLGLHPGPLRRTYVASTLWPDVSEDHAHGSLRSALWRLHRVGAVLVDARDQRLALAGHVDVDVREAAELTRRLLDGGVALDDESAVHRLVRLSGELLPDWYDEWVLVEREQLRQLRLHALEELADELLRAGRLTPASEAALAAVAADPLRESAHRALIRVHLAEGNGADALRQYRFYSRLVREQLGLAPSRRMEDLIETVERPRAGDAPVTVG